MEGATVDDFVAGSVAALTRPFVCDHATLQALAAPEHAAVRGGAVLASGAVCAAPLRAARSVPPFSPVPRSQVLRGVADVNRKLVKDWSSFYAGLRAC